MCVLASWASSGSDSSQPSTPIGAAGGRRAPAAAGCCGGAVMIPARLKPFALKFFFSNQYLYAHVQRRADGVVRARCGGTHVACG